MGEPSIDSLHDTYEDQLSAARFKAERDAARQEADKSLMDAMTWEMEAEGMADELVHIEVENKRLGHLVWRLQNRLARSHRREKALRKGMRMWREKAIGGPVRTVSAYDLLPEEDMQTLRWVREQGGLSHVKDILHDFRAVVERIGIEWSESELHGLMNALDRRLMPEDMEWPRYEDGEPVRIWDKIEDIEVRSIVFNEGGILLSDCTSVPGWGTWRSYKERVKRPVLAADGEPLEVGQTVYHTDTGREYQIHSISDDGKGAFIYNNSLGQDAAGLHLCHVGNLTHQRPVLDADGVPVKVGDTVWYRGHIDPLGVKSVTVCVNGPDYVTAYSDYEGKVSAPAEFFTHTKPEPQEKTCGDCRFWQSDPDASQIGVCWNSYAERDSYDSYEARVKRANACEVFEERGE